MPENTSLAGRTALITGGGVGIGAEIAVALAAAGARVAATYRNHPPSVGVLQRLRAGGQEPAAMAVDGTDDSDVGDAVDSIARSFGGVDILVNNIGGLVRRAGLEDLDLDAWRSILSVNLDPMFLFSHHALDHLSRGDSGRIINIASLAGHTGGHAGALAYATAKAGVFGFTRSLATELGPSGVTVNAIAPGFIEGTPFHDTFTTDESKQQTISGIPVGRAGRPADVASAAVWLASDSSAFVNGAVVDVNGGQYFH